jgi:putative ABC transport system permease protein
MNEPFQNVRFALRQLRKSPRFTVVAVLTLAIGTGASTAIFSIVHAVLLKPLTYTDPDRIVLISNGATPTRYEEMRNAARSYAGIGVFAGPEDTVLSGIGEPEVLKGVRVSANFLDILGVSPRLGRGFLPEEDQLGAPPVVMISTGLWQRRFGSDSSTLGRTITLAGIPHTIVGVLPTGFQFSIAGTDVWFPRPAEWSVISPEHRHDTTFLSIFGRLRPNVDLKEASAELAVLRNQYAVAHPEMFDAKRELPDVVQPLKRVLVADVRAKLWMLFGATGLVMLIVCANLASLVLARSTGRAREFAIRAAIGAGRWHIAKQLLVENALLTSVGGALGVALAALSLRVISSQTFVDLPRAAEIQLDRTVLGFTLALTSFTAILFGLLPSLSASRPDLAYVLKGSSELKGVSGPWRWRFGWRGVLVVGEVALSITLLISTALLVKSLAFLYQVDPGFQPAQLLTMSLSLSPSHYETDETRARFYEDLIERVETIPGVRSAAITLTLPMADGWLGTTLFVAGRPPLPLNERPIGILQKITPGFFKTLQIPLRRGREFARTDNLHSLPVAVISESLARVLWPQYPAGADPLGQYVLVGSDPQLVEVVGVAADVRQIGRDEDPRPGIYLPCLQRPPSFAKLAVRTNGDPLLFPDVIRAQVLAIDPEQPVSAIATMDDLVDASEGQRRLMMRLVSLFAGVALLTATIGLHGIVGYFVAQRTKEIGIRQALGASRTNIFKLVVEQGIGLALAGILLGVCIAFAVTRVLESLLFHVSAIDPPTFIGVSMLFVVVALFACFLPAKRATEVDPMVALRYE